MGAIAKTREDVEDGDCIILDENGLVVYDGEIAEAPDMKDDWMVFLSHKDFDSMCAFIAESGEPAHITNVC